MAQINLASNAVPTLLAAAGSFSARVYVWNNDNASKIYYDYSANAANVTVATGIPILPQTGAFIEIKDRSFPFAVYLVQTSGAPVDVRYIVT